MLKKRLIFTLLFSDGYFMLSRNFQLQKVGDIIWLEKNYKFFETSKYIDEIIIINVDKKKRNLLEFGEVVKRVVSKSFIPVTAGGGIKYKEDAAVLFKSGADKILINTLYNSSANDVSSIIKEFGTQAVVCGIDYKKRNNLTSVFTNNGQDFLGIELEDYIEKVLNIGVGEIYLNSMEKDGTGQGFDIETIKRISYKVPVPVIAAGGAGKPEHFVEVLSYSINAAATANLFNFIGDGLKNTRSFLIETGIKLPQWDNLY